MCSRFAIGTEERTPTASLRRTVVAYLELVRVPNLFTAIADVLAGFLYAAGADSSWNSLPVLCAASVCLYAGGVTLNDVFDVEEDRAVRPDRPVPSGRISRRGAATIAATLLLMGLLLAGLSSGRAAVIGSLLVVCIVLYDGFLKHTPLAPVLMGACRALNLLLGIGVSLDPTTISALVPAGLLGLYVASVTQFASHEARSPRRAQLVPGACGLLLSVAGLTVLQWTVALPQRSYVMGVTVVFCIVAASVGGAVRALTPSATQRAVRTFLVMLVGFDACIAWASAGVDAGLLVGSLLVPSALFSRLFRMT